MTGDVQSYWEVPCIAHFCSLYRKTFDLLDFDIEELEEALLTDSSDEEIGNSLIQDLIVRLLKGCFNSQQKDDITSFNYQMYLRRLFRIKCEENSSRQNPFNSDIAFHSLPLKKRVELLHDLCNFRLEAEVIPESLQVLESDSLRVRPLGRDSGGSTYWYFYGTRLYREDYNTKPKNLPLKKHLRKYRRSDGLDAKWEIACTTEEDWQLLTNKFKNCKSKDEKALHERLRDQFLPELPRLFAEREKLMSKRMMDPQPRRSNRAVPPGLLTIPPTPSHPAQKSSSVLFDELQSLKESEEKEKEAKRKAGMGASGANNSATGGGSTSADRSSDDDESVKQDSQLSAGELAQRQKEEQEKADRLFAEQLEREERMARLHLRERGLSGAGGRSRGADLQMLSALTASAKESSKAKSQAKRRSGSSSPSRSRSRSEKRKGTGKSKVKKVKSARMTNNSLSASLLRDSDDNDSDQGDDSGSDDEGGKHSSSDSQSDGESTPKRSRKGGDSPTKKDIRKRVFSGSSRAKQKKSKSPVAEKRKKFSAEAASSSKSSSKSHSKKSTTNSSSGFGLGTSKTKVKSSFLFSQNEEDVLIGMHKVIETVKAHRDAWPFVNPVDEEYAPGYFKVVKEPMDIQTMEDKLDNQEYQSVDEFKDDFQKIVDNCRLYNGASSEYTEMVETIEELFNKTIQRVMIQDESDDEEISIEYADTGSGQKKKRNNASATEKTKLESKKRKPSAAAASEEDNEGPSTSKSKSKKEPSRSGSREEEKASSKSSAKAKKEQLMRHHSHKSDKDGRKVVSATAEALKDINKWLGETPVGVPVKQSKKEKRKQDDGGGSSDDSTRNRSYSKLNRFGGRSVGNAGLPAPSLEFASAFEAADPARKKKYMKTMDKESKLSSSRERAHDRDGDDKSKPVKKRHRHHSSEQKKHSGAEGNASDREEKARHHHHHHHHRRHSHSSGDGEVASISEAPNGSQIPPKKREGSSVSGPKRRKPNSSGSSSPAPVRKSGSKKDGNDGADARGSAGPLANVKEAGARIVAKRKGDGKGGAKKPLMKRSMSLLQGFKNSGSLKRPQVGKATKFNIKHSMSLSLESESSRDNSSGAPKPDFMAPWKRSSGAKAVAAPPEPGASAANNRSATTAATAEFLKWQQAERGAGSLESRFNWLKNKKDGPKLSLGTVLPKHAINLSGLKYNEAPGSNGLSDTEQNGSTHEEDEEEDDEDEDLYSKLERGLANLSRGTLSDKARELLASNPALAAKIAMNGVDNVRREELAGKEEENKQEEGAAGTSVKSGGTTSKDRKLEPAKGFNAEKSLPNLSAWFKAFGAPSSNSSSGASTAATTPTTGSTREDNNTSPTTPPAHGITKPKFRVMGRTPGGEKTASGGKTSVDSSHVKSEQQLSVGGSGGASKSKSPPSGGKQERKESEKTRRGPQQRNRKASTSSLSSQSEVGSPAVYYGSSGNNQDSGVINPPRWADSGMDHPNWGSQSQSPSASSQVSSQSPAGPNSPFSPAPISSPPETPPRPIGPVRVGFYQDITNSSSQHSSPEKAGSNESPQNIINVTSPATPPTSSAQSQPSAPKRETSVLKGYPSYAPNYAQRYGVNNSNSPSPSSGPATPGNNVKSPPSVETRPAPDSPPVSTNSNKTYTHLESKKQSSTSEAIPPRVVYDPPRWSPYPPGHPLYHPPALPRAHLASAPASSPHSDLFSPNPPNYSQPESYGQPEAAHSRNSSRYNPNSLTGGPQAAHSNSQPQAAHAHQYSTPSSSSSSTSSVNMSQLLRSGTPLMQSQLPSYTSNPYASNPRNVNVPPNIYNNPIADRIGGGLGMMPLSSSSALTLTNTASTSSSGTSSRGKKGHQHHQQQQQSSNEPGSGKSSSDMASMNGFQWPHPHHPMAGLTQIVNNLPGAMNPYISRAGHHPHYDPEAMAKYARSGGVVDPMGYTNLSAGSSKSVSHPHPEMLAKGLVNLSTNSSGAPSASAPVQTSGSKATTSGGRRGRGEGKKTKAAVAAAAAAAQQQQSQQQQQQQPIVPGSAFNFSSLSTDLCLYPKEIASGVRSGSSSGTATPGPTQSPYTIPPYIGSHPSPYHQAQPSQSPFGSSPRGMVDPYQQFFQGSPHVLPLLTPTSSYAQAYAAAAAHNPSAHGLGFTRPGWI